MPSSASFPARCRSADINLDGAAITPLPAIAVNFRSFDTVCGEPVRCAVEIADSRPAAGPGHARLVQPRRHLELHGDEPDRTSKPALSTPAPASNADLGRTIARVLMD